MLKLFQVFERPSIVLVSKLDVPMWECRFVLDFQRPLQRLRWLGIRNARMGLTIAYGVPVLHLSETNGQLIATVCRRSPWFRVVTLLWRIYGGRSPGHKVLKASASEVGNDFSRHFAEDAQRGAT